jgi:hypothetical protein
MNRLTNWGEAAENPWRTVVAMCVGGAAGGFLVGYVDHSVGTGLALAVGLAANGAYAVCLVLGLILARSLRS